MKKILLISNQYLNKNGVGNPGTSSADGSALNSIVGFFQSLGDYAMHELSTGFSQFKSILIFLLITEKFICAYMYMRAACAVLGA